MSASSSTASSGRLLQYQKVRLAKLLPSETWRIFSRGSAPCTAARIDSYCHVATTKSTSDTSALVSRHRAILTAWRVIPERCSDNATAAITILMQSPQWSFRQLTSFSHFDTRTQLGCAQRSIEKWQCWSNPLLVLR